MLEVIHTMCAEGNCLGGFQHVVRSLVVVLAYICDDIVCVRRLAPAQIDPGVGALCASLCTLSRHLPVQCIIADNGLRTYQC